MPLRWNWGTLQSEMDRPFRATREAAQLRFTNLGAPQPCDGFPRSNRNDTTARRPLEQAFTGARGRPLPALYWVANAVGMIGRGAGIGIAAGRGAAGFATAGALDLGLRGWIVEVTMPCGVSSP